MEINKDITAGQSVYSNMGLAIYDILVLSISSPYIWKCPTKKILEHFNKNITNNHLDVGAGTGYFIDKCTFSIDKPTVAIMDLNKNSLNVTEKRIKRYNPKKYRENILGEITTVNEKYDSISINYVLHCLPGNLHSKAKVFENLMPLLNENGVLFGSTILSDGVTKNSMAKVLMSFYNKKGIFCNKEDSLESLESILASRFTQYSIEVVGCVALFQVKKSNLIKKIGA